tara:strand:- start:552 stop:935 length:384 start_codon:yes stop_codon:yes gene_type:complete
MFINIIFIINNRTKYIIIRHILFSYNILNMVQKQITEGIIESIFGKDYVENNNIISLAFIFLFALLIFHLLTDLKLYNLKLITNLKVIILMILNFTLIPIYFIIITSINFLTYFFKGFSNTPNTPNT